MNRLIVAFFLWCGVLLVPGQEPGRTVNSVAVIVNDKVITYRDVRILMAAEVEFLERRYAGQPAEREAKIRELMRKQIEDLVQRELILHEYKSGGYAVAESFIETQINDDIRQHGDRLTLSKTLQAQGLNWEAYRQKIRDRIIIDLMWRHHVPRDPVISPHKIEKYYQANQDKFEVGDQVKLRVIVFARKPGDGPEVAKALASEVLGKIEEGVPFHEMAAIYSQGSTRAEGGNWGWVERSVLREDLAERAFSMKPGERSGIIESNEGCFLLLVEDVRPAHVRPLTEVRVEIENTLKDMEQQRLREKWMERLKEKSFIRYF